MNNLETLNNQLFETLDQLKNDKIDIKKASAIVEVSNTITNTNKTMLSAYKLTNKEKYKSKAQENANLLPSQESLYDRKEAFAKEKGYKSLGDALVKLGKQNFEDLFISEIQK